MRTGHESSWDDGIPEFPHGLTSSLDDILRIDILLFIVATFPTASTQSHPKSTDRGSIRPLQLSSSQQGDSNPSKMPAKALLYIPCVYVDEGQHVRL